MKAIPSACRYLAVMSATLGVVSCSFLKSPPAGPRSFMLTALPAASAGSQSTGPETLTLGMGLVKVPGYLLRRSMAVRQDNNEVVYLDKAMWAERVDTGLQRVLASNLGALLSTDKVRLAPWRSEETSVEVHVQVERFDVDVRGEAMLTAWWRVLSRGGRDVIASGHFSASRSGRPPAEDPGGAAASLSALAAELSESWRRRSRGTGHRPWGFARAPGCLHKAHRRQEQHCEPGRYDLRFSCGPVTDDSFAEVWERTVPPHGNDLSVHAARYFLNLRFMDADLARMNELAARARVGSLTPGEEAELGNYMQLGWFLDLMKSKARLALGLRPAEGFRVRDGGNAGIRCVSALPEFRREYRLLPESLAAPPSRPTSRKALTKLSAADRNWIRARCAR